MMQTDTTHTTPVLDTLQNIETPEGVVLALRPAGLLPRALAWLIDGLIKLAIMVVAMFIYASLGRFGVGVGLIVLFATTWGYSVLFEVLNKGATPGKAALDLQVVLANGAPVSWSASIIRNFLRLADMLPIIYGVGTIVTLTSDKFQRLGDIAADTLVVYRAASPDPIAPLDPAVAAPLRIALSADEQKTVMAFGDRVGLLSESRARELAGILAPVLGTADDLALARLTAHAKHLAGRT